MAIVAVAGDLLDPGVGTWVKDTEATTWSVDTSSPGDSAWAEVNAPWLISAELVTGTMAGTAVELSFYIQQADDGSGTNEEIIAAFPLVTEADDDETHVIPVEITKQYVQVVSSNTGGAATGTCVLTLRDLDYHRYSRTAG